MSTFNIVVFTWIHRLVGRNIFLDGTGIFLAEWLPYFLVIGFFIFIFSKKDVRERFALFAEATLAIILSRGIITTAIHFFYYHPRPFDFYGFAPLISESGSSFPSGHAAWFFALAMMLWYADRKWGWWYFGAAIVMGIARIYVGVHWPLDIIGGAVIGIGSAIAVHFLLYPGTQRKTAKSTSAQP
jgi:undecaprenyl-diphosphatase